MKTTTIFVWMDAMACLGDELPYREDEAGFFHMYPNIATEKPLRTILVLNRWKTGWKVRSPISKT